MCSGGGSATGEYLEQARLARISTIKSKQRARKTSVDVVTGGGTKEYRRSMATGAKQIGTTAAQESLRSLSAMFSGRMGEGAVGVRESAQIKAVKLRTKREDRGTAEDRLQGSIIKRNQDRGTAEDRLQRSTIKRNRDRKTAGEPMSYKKVATMR